MKTRAVLAWIAAFWAASGLSFAQSPSRAPAVTPIPEPTPRTSVIAVSTPQPAIQPVKVPPPAIQSGPEIAPRASVVAAPTQPVKLQPPDAPPSVMPSQGPMSSPLPMPKAVPNEAKDQPILAPSEFVSPDRQGYTTHVLDCVSPWTAHGRRSCGSIYVDTPYNWINVGFLFGVIKNDTTPLRVTRSASTAANAGSRNDRQATVLYDGQDLHDQPFYGGRFNGGMWFGECQFLGAELGYFYFGAHDNDFLMGALPGSTGIFIPFANALTNTEEAFAIGGTNGTAGMIKINSRTFFQGADGHALISVGRGCNFRIDGLVGVRWLSLDEDITIEDVTRGIRILSVTDHFGTRNEFIGADLGLKAHWRRNCWALDLMSRIAVGGTIQTVRIDGTSTIEEPNFLPSTVQGGRLATLTNIGSHDNDAFSLVPEIGATIGWQPRRWLKMSVGYNGLFWTNVARPGGQIDRVVNPNGVPFDPAVNPNGPVPPARLIGQVPEPPRPTALSQQTDFWAQSVTFGLQFMY